jgi:hypothetical protein
VATKLGIYTERVIEAGWLLAIIVTPLFFNVYSIGRLDRAACLVESWLPLCHAARSVSSPRGRRAARGDGDGRIPIASGRNRVLRLDEDHGVLCPAHGLHPGHAGI